MSSASESHETKQDRKVVRVGQFDEFTKDEKLFADPDVERTIDEMESEPGFTEGFTLGVMDAIKPEDNPSDASHNVIGRRRMHQRMREVEMAKNRGEAAPEPGKIIRFKPPTRRP